MFFLKIFEILQHLNNCNKDAKILMECSHISSFQVHNQSKISRLLPKLWQCEVGRFKRTGFSTGRICYQMSYPVQLITICHQINKKYHFKNDFYIQVSRKVKNKQLCRRMFYFFQFVIKVCFRGIFFQPKTKQLAEVSLDLLNKTFFLFKTYT